MNYSISTGVNNISTKIIVSLTVALGLLFPQIVNKKKRSRKFKNKIGRFK